MKTEMWLSQTGNDVKPLRSRRGTLIVCRVSGMAAAFLAVFWLLNISSSLTNPKKLSAAPKPKQKSETAETATDEKAKRVKLNYISASWQKVFQDMEMAFELEFIGDQLPKGRFSRMDRGEYSLKDAIRIVNKEIEPQGLRLIVKSQFLILIDIASTRKEYPPAVLPTKSKPQPVVEDVAESDRPDTFRVQQIRKNRDAELNHADYQDDPDGRSVRRQSNALRERSYDEQSISERSRRRHQKSGSQSIRQASMEESEGEAEPLSSRKTNPFESSIPGNLENVGAPAPHVVYRARNLRSVDLSKKIYRAMKSDAELVEEGRDGLPAFRVVNPEFLSNESNPQKKNSMHPVDFMISIDESRNELLVDGSAKDIRGVLKLLRVIDRPSEDQVETHIKSSTRYVCQIADQLPVELERIRAANNKALARLPVEGKAPWIAQENQRRVPDLNDNHVETNDKPSDEPETVVDETLGNFKGEVNIEVIEDLNVMIIRGNERDVEQIERVIKRIEKLSEATAPRVNLIPLENVDAESLAELLVSVYEKLTKFPGRATQPRESVAIIPVSKPNSLLVVAPEAEFELILDLVEKLDQPVDPLTEFQVFRLKSAPASDVEAMVTEFYKERKSLGAKVLIIADPRSNSVIIRAQPRDLDEITALIEKVDRDEVGAVNTVKFFTLKNAIATDIANVINSAIQSVLSPPRSSASGSGAGGGGGNNGAGGGQVEEQFRSAKSAVLQFLAVDKGSSRQVRSGILSDIRVTPDAHTNTLIVTASEKSMDLVEALIKTLDRPTSTVSVIKVFTLVNADAQQMVSQLNSLFNSRQQGAGTGNQGGIAQLGIVLANADDASSSLVPLKFSVDTRTNSVIAVGSAESMSVVEAVLSRLDESNLRSRELKVVRLNNAPAPDIALAITNFFQSQRELVQADPNLVSNVEQLEREVIAIPDPVSNNLLVSVTPRYYPIIMEMIKKLDKEPKQVVIQALIVEVQLNNTDEFGIELGLQSPVLFDRSLLGAPNILTQTTSPGGSGGTVLTSQNVLSTEGTPGFNFNNPSFPLGNNVFSNAVGVPPASPGIVGGQSLTNFSLGRTDSQLGYGGLVLSASSNSVNAMLRALASQTKIQILSRPTIRALDNQLATVFVGRTIPTVRSFIPNANTGVLTPVLEQRETGIGMNVTPRINQEGNVVIRLTAFRSQLSNEAVNVTTDSRGQPINQRITDLSNMTSTVLVPANSTIVIGGMISSRDETQNRKVPLLGDVPLLGRLFRYDARATTRSELLIFLTPRIINGPEDEENLKEIEIGRLHFLESEAEKAHGPLRAIPAAEPEDVFCEENPSWITPEMSTPSTTPATQPATPEIIESSPIMLPPSPAVLPPTPPTPDPGVTQINALRKQTADDESQTSDIVTTANWTSSSNATNSSAKQRKNVKKKSLIKNEK